MSNDNRAPRRPPPNAPIDNSIACIKSGWPNNEWIIKPLSDANIKTSCDVGAAFLIEMPIPITISGTNITPPPIPNKPEIIPAKKLDPAVKIIIEFFKLYGFSDIFLLMKMYTAEEVKITANVIWNMAGVIISETNAPRIVPGIHIKPNFNPIPYSILFCFAYMLVDATALVNTANKLLLAANVGGNPANIITGTAIIAPPSPIIEPNIPVANPNGINHKFSIIIGLKNNITRRLTFSFDKSFL